MYLSVAVGSESLLISLIHVHKRLDVVGVGRRGLVMRMFADIQISFLPVAISRFPTLVLFHAGNLIETIATSSQRNYYDLGLLNRLSLAKE